MTRKRWATIDDDGIVVQHEWTGKLSPADEEYQHLVNEMGRLYRITSGLLVLMRELKRDMKEHLRSHSERGS